ncbi:MAG: signal peptidase I [Spirochaetes bacterium GWB1_36_13]|nr:MAG: signal peptidase I [Spirochaetes bacterium GWB1_36_13]
MLKHEHYVVKTKWHKIKENVKGILVAIFIALLIRVFLVEPYKIPTSSMYPTILEGDMIMANKFWYGVRVPVANIKLPAFSSPDVGNIILFETPTYYSPGKGTELLNFVTFGLFGLDNNEHNPKYFIKRTIGSPGDVISIANPRKNNFTYQIEVNGVKAPLEAINGSPADFPDKNDYTFYIENLNGIKHFVQYSKEKYTSFQVELPQDVEGMIYIPKEDDVITFTKIEADPLQLKLKIENEGKIKEVVLQKKVVEKFYYKEGKINSILTYDDLSELEAKGMIKKSIHEDFFLAMGDNRDNSYDSRIWGLVNQSLLLGSPLFRHFPFGRFGSINKLN